MKKTISLRIELLLLMLVSLVVSLMTVITLRNQGLLFSNTSQDKRIHKIKEEGIDEVVTTLNQISLEDIEKVEEFFETYRYQVGYEFYLTDLDGNVCTGTDKGMQKINLSELVSSKQDYTVSKVDQNVFRIQGLEPVQNTYYLYYSYLNYDENDTGILIIALLMAGALFFLFIWGRISYISTIRKSVSMIKNGNLSYRVPYHYQNELYGLAVDINSMTKTLEDEETKKNQFLTNISHDIRTPLTTMLGYLEMMKNKKYESQEELEEYITIMQRKGNTLAAMLEDFFQYSKLESGDMKYEPIPFSINELIRQSCEDMREEFQKNGLSLQIQLAEEKSNCYGDPELIARVINNLLSNALKYSAPNSNVQIQSGDTKLDKKKYTMLCVRNIPRDQLEDGELQLLFDRLYKHDASRQQQGSGLGLSIVKSIVRLHQGMVKVRKEGDWFELYVYLQTEPTI